MSSSTDTFDMVYCFNNYHDLDECDKRGRAVGVALELIKSTGAIGNFDEKLEVLVNSIEKQLAN